VNARKPIEIIPWDVIRVAQHMIEMHGAEARRPDYRSAVEQRR